MQSAFIIEMNNAGGIITRGGRGSGEMTTDELQDSLPSPGFRGTLDEAEKAWASAISHLRPAELSMQ